MLEPMEAKQIISVDVNGHENKLHLHADVVDSLLLSDDVANKPVVEISVAGAYRMGKSFLLNMMSRYLMAADKLHWQDNNSESFLSQGGCEAHTNGIFMSHPIPVTLDSGEEVVVLLMDSQGIFDDNSTTTDSTKIFALSTLLSSVLIFNVTSNLKTDDLDHLQLFAEYGRVATDNTDGKPFQDLVFLVRDWYHTNNHPVGRRGGNDLVEKRLSSTNKGSLAKGREHIKACFTGISGFLLPHPGKEVAEGTFTGDAATMEPTFSRALDELMATLLSPEKLSVKMNGDRPMTCRQLVTHIKTYTDLFRSKELPELSSYLQATAEASNVAAVNDDFHAYKQRMNDLLRPEAPMIDGNKLFEEHDKAKTDALKSWQLRRTMRDPTRDENYYHALLETNINDWYEEAYKNKLTQDILKAEKANQKLADKCFKKAQTSTKRNILNPLSFIGASLDTKTCEKHKEASQKALKNFDKGKITFTTYNAADIRDKLEKYIDKLLEEAMKVNDTAGFSWRLACFAVVGGAVTAPVMAGVGLMGGGAIVVGEVVTAAAGGAGAGASTASVYHGIDKVVGYFVRNNPLGQIFKKKEKKHQE